MIAALYVALTFLANALGLASGAIQFRLSEALAVLPFFTPAAIKTTDRTTMHDTMITNAKFCFKKEITLLFRISLLSSCFLLKYCPFRFF